MSYFKSILILLLVWLQLSAGAQTQPAAKKPTAASLNYDAAVQKLSALLTGFGSFCQKPNDTYVLQLLANDLKRNKKFLSEWEIGSNNSDAQIAHVLCAASKVPYVIEADSSSKSKFTCTIPDLPRSKALPTAASALQILDNVDTENGHDLIYEKPDAGAKSIGKVKAGQQYIYYPGTTAYSASVKGYVTDAIKYNGEGTINYVAIVLNEAAHKLGYVVTDATTVSLPVLKL
jgi:hypothetical protein